MLRSLICLLPLCMVMPAFAQPGNALRDHPSPYLALHADDPVHWQVWGPPVLERARREGKLILVSSGYYACHWCHVMQRESFQDAQVAARLNAEFIAVKIDRELEPVLDAQLIEFMETARGYAGWPLNVFLSPEGHPLTGVVYQPREEFLAFLARLQERWQAEPTGLTELARRGAEALARRLAQNQDLVAEVTPDDLERGFMREVRGLADDMAGGFGHQSKFPSVPQLEALLALEAHREEPWRRGFLTLTLDKMAQAGLHDHLGGGFFRYTVDPDWQTPHFEKMLYDNALLARLYLRAAEVLVRPDYRDVGLATLRFMRTELRGREGAMIASLSALDDRDVEGGYYLWGREEAKALLTSSEWAVAGPVWGFDRPPLLEHGHLPVPAQSLEAVAARLGISKEVAAERLESARGKLLAARAARGLPRDDKRLAGWNGLALSALVAGAQAGDAASAQAAEQVAAFLRRRLWREGEGLSRAVDAAGRPLGPGNLQDYAYVGEGLLAYARHTGRSEDLRLAQAVLTAGWRRFHGEAGWRLAADGLLPLEPRLLHAPEGPVPSPTAVMLRASLALEVELAGPAQAAARQITQALVLEPFLHAGHVALTAACATDATQK